VSCGKLFGPFYGTEHLPTLMNVDTGFSKLFVFHDIAVG